MCQEIFDREFIFDVKVSERQTSIEILRDYAFIKQVVWQSTISRDPLTGKPIAKELQVIDIKNLLVQCLELKMLLEIHESGLISRDQSLSEKSILNRFSRISSVRNLERLYEHVWCGNKDE